MMTRAAMALPALILAGAVQAGNPVFDQIKSMEGTWYAVDESGAPTDRVVSKFEVTANGTAVRETEFPGKAHEMVTMYHLVDGKVIADHYCVLGNKPSYRVVKTDEGLAYQLVNRDEVAKPGKQYMGEGYLVSHSDNRVETRWMQFEDGEKVDKVRFDMARKANP